MIALILAGALLAQDVPASEDEALFVQSLERILDAEEALAFTQGRCLIVYPTGQQDPFAIQAQQSVANLGDDVLTMSVVRLRQMRFAEGAEAAGTDRPTIRQCVAEIDEAATDLSAHVEGMAGLVRTLEARE